MKIEKTILQSLCNNIKIVIFLFLSVVFDSNCLLYYRNSYTLDKYRNITNIMSYIGRNMYKSYDANNKSYINVQMYEHNYIGFTQIIDIEYEVSQCKFSQDPMNISMITTQKVGNNIKVNQQKIDLLNLKSILMKSTNHTQYSNIFIQVDRSNQIFYQFFVTNNSINFANGTYLTTISMKARVDFGTSQTYLWTLYGKTVQVAFSQSQVFAILYQDYITYEFPVTVFSLYSSNFTLLFSSALNYTGLEYKLSCSYQYVAYTIDKNLYIVDIISLTYLWNYTTTQSFLSIQLIYPWLCILQSNNVLKQYHVATGQLYDKKLTSFGSFSKYFDYYNDKYYIVCKDRMHFILYQLQVTDQYYFNNATNVACKTGYALINGKCSASIPTLIYQLTNKNITTNTSSNPIVPVVPQKNSSTNTKNVNQICFKFYDTNSNTIINSTGNNNQVQQYCQQYCSENCQSCQSSRTACKQCAQYYIISEKSGSCELSTSVYFVSLIYAYLNSIKYSKTYAIFAFLNNLDLYQYHKIQYTGILQSIFKFLNFIQKKQWQLVPTQSLRTFFDRSWFENIYIGYTNQFYARTEREDLTFLQNIKQYLIIYIPVITLLFIVLNRLFYCSFNHKISMMFRIFSFWLYLVGLIILNDVQRLAYLSSMQIMNLFHFTFGGLMLQVLSILIIGIWFFCCISLYIMYEYFYDKNCKYFFNNISKKNKSVLFMIIKFILKPIIQGIIHAILSKQPKIQLFILTALQLVSFILTCILQMKYSIFRIKAIFVIDCLLQLSICLMNIYLYIKHIIGPLSVQDVYEELFQTMEQCIVVLVNFSAFILAMDLFLAIFENLRELFKVRDITNTKKQIQTHTRFSNIFKSKKKFSGEFRINSANKIRKISQMSDKKMIEHISVLQEWKIKQDNDTHKGFIYQKNPSLQSLPIKKRIQNKVNRFVEQQNGHIVEKRIQKKLNKLLYHHKLKAIATKQNISAKQQRQVKQDEKRESKNKSVTNKQLKNSNKEQKQISNKVKFKIMPSPTNKQV